MHLAYSGSAVIVQDNVEVAVECDVFVGESRGGHEKWNGSFHDPHPQYVLDRGQPDAVLRLPDGREGKIFITEHDIVSVRDTPSQEHGAFEGNGPSPWARGRS